MIEQQNGGGHFDKVTLYPMVTIKDATKAKEAEALHQKANKYCFIANSVNFKVYHDCTIIIG
jgi:organic hydroperoxide reductase OsmC/OhrA